MKFQVVRRIESSEYQVLVTFLESFPTGRAKHEKKGLATWTRVVLIYASIT